MCKKTVCFFILSFLISGILSAQEDIAYSSGDIKNSEVRSCDRVHVEDKSYNALSKKSFAIAEPYYMRSYNSKDDFAAFQIGKRKGSKVFLYIKLFKFNACVKNNESLEIITENGITYSFKNKFKVNCQGELVVELNKKEIKELSMNKISSFMLLSFQKDYEFHINQETSQKISEDLICLEEFKF